MIKCDFFFTKIFKHLFKLSGVINRYKYSGTLKKTKLYFCRRGLCFSNKGDDKILKD